MKASTCRINVILAVSKNRLGDIPIRRLKGMTSAVTHKVVQISLPCFARVVDRFDLTDMEEFTTSARSEGLIVISSDLVASHGEVGASALARQLLDTAQKTKLPMALVGVVSSSRVLPRIPPMGLDSLVIDGDDMAEQLNEAVQLLAARIWLMLPPEPGAVSQVDSNVVIDFPRSLDDFRGILALRFKIYQTLGYLQPEIQEASSQLDFDAFDSNAIHLLARDMGSGEIIGCARLIVPDAMLSAEQRQTWCKTVAEQEESRAYRDILKYGTGGQPLPAASMGAYAALRSTLKASHPGLRAEDCCELSRLIVAPKARGQRLSRRLTEAAVQIAVSWLARTIMIIECREHHRVLYEHYGFQLTGDIGAERAGQVHAQAITMWRDLKKSNGAPPRRPNAHVVLPSSRPEEVALPLRRALPAEAWIWNRVPAPTDKGARGTFEVSLHNHGIASATVQGLIDLLKRSGHKRITICNEPGDSVDITVAGPADPPPSSVVPQILNLVRDVRGQHA
jgi:predicted GNAT family N-acyltransferase